MSHLLAQTNLGTFNGLGPLGNPPDSPLKTFEDTISLIIGVLTIFAGLWFIFQMFAGASQWLASGGEKQALQNAQKRITHALVGLVLVLISYTLIALVGYIFGFRILDVSSTVLNISP